MSGRLKRALDGLLWLLRPTGLRKSVAQLEERLHRMEARQLEIESRVNLLVSPTNVPVPVHGHYLYLDRHDTLGLSLHHTHEPFQTELLEGLLKAGEVAVDAGAHIGYFSLLFARKVGGGGRVIAFEASPRAHVLLRRNVIANGYANVDLHEAALHRERTRIAFFTCEDGLAGGATYHPGGGLGWERLEVDAVRLDDVVPPGGRVDLVKMDIQGAEGHALEGMQRCLADNPGCRLLIEYWPRGLAACGTPAPALLERLAGLGFRFADVRESERRIVETSPADLRERYPDDGYGQTNLLCTRK